MNYWLIEVLAESRRGQILAEMQQIRLAQQHQTLQFSLFGRGMLRLADWMIAAGRDLRCRYDIRAADCSRVGGGGLARQGR